MDLCFFSAQYLPTVGGVERYTFNLAQRCAAAGHKVRVVTSALPGLPDAETDAHGIRVIRLPAWPLLNGRFPALRPVKARRLAERELWAVPPEFCLINTRFYPASLWAARQCRRRRIPAAVVEHGSAYLMTGAAPVRWAGMLYEHLAARLVYRWVPHFYGVSGACCRWLEHFGIRAEGCLYNAVDPDELRALARGSKIDWRGRLGLPADALLIAYAGRVLPEKGVEAMADALPAIRAAVPGASMVLVGDGPLRAPLAARRQPGLYLPGPAPYADALALLAQADVFCMPSRSEGFACTVLEAAALDCPILTTATGGSPELITGPDCGTLLPDRRPETVAAACVAVLRNPAWRQTAAGNARCNLEARFTWEATTRRFLALAEESTKGTCE